MDRWRDRPVPCIRGDNKKQNHQKKRDPYADSILQFLESEQLLQWVNIKAGFMFVF